MDPTSVKKIHAPALGIIEGFFGRSWSWQERTGYADFLAGNDYQFYIYAPKDDRYLRRNWQQDWPEQDFEALRTLREYYRARSLQFGIGLSPYEIYCNPGSDQRALLINKIRRINQLQPDILGLLFDDMRGDLPGLARIQCELVNLVSEYSQAQRIIFCPTYYSFDPVLEKVFGARPQHYWEMLGAGLDQQIDIFWTGPKVCSTDYPQQHLRDVAALLQRKPFLWDNYPVNDGAIKSGHLHLRAFGEDRAQLAGYVAGHAANPMNQPWLSRIPLATLPHAYREGPSYSASQAFAQACSQVCGKDGVEYLLKDIPLLQDLGLKEFSGEQSRYLLTRYQPLAAQAPWAREICDWLSGGYAFDPACLTD